MIDYMIDYWKQFAAEEQEDDSVCTNANACDHLCCPEHGDPEDDWQVPTPTTAMASTTRQI